VPTYDCGPVPAVAVGPASVERLPPWLASVGGTRAAIVADPAVVASGYMARVVDALDGAEVSVHVVPPSEPTERSVHDLTAEVRATGDAVVIGIGGGTALDSAKLVAVLAEADHDVERYLLGAHALPRRRPLVAIPSTAGTGSEVTRTCVLTDREGRKVWTWGAAQVPDLVLLDPFATQTMPPHVTTASGLDAFVHAVEATSGRGSSTLAAANGVEAARLVLEHLPRAVADGDDLEVRQAMQEAALLAGLAIDRGGTGMAHAVGHALGTLAHVPHGVAVAVGLAATLAWSVAGAPGAFEPLTRSLGCQPSDLPECYAALVRACGLPDAVYRTGPLEVPIDQLASVIVAAENVPMYENNCRRADDRERGMLAAATLATWDELWREGRS
jgi:alcohol dehydrogenase class IV